MPFVVGCFSLVSGRLEGFLKNLGIRMCWGREGGGGKQASASSLLHTSHKVYRMIPDYKHPTRCSTPTKHPYVLLLISPGPMNPLSSSLA